MKKKGIETWLYSSLGVLAMFVILLVVNAIGSRAKQRIDLTAERAYTLSPGTRAILAKLDTPVQVRFYCTRGDNRMPVMLKTYAQQIEDLLGELRQASKGQIEIQKLDPVPDSDAEDSARLDGIEGQQVQLGGEPFYLGVSVSMLDQKETLPFLAPNRERLLEYDLVRAVSRVMTADKPVVGVMSPLQIAGQPMNPMMARMGQRGQQPWVLFSELKSDFSVQQIEMTAETIPDAVKVLIVVHPKDISDAALYAIDQFLLRGGKLMAFLDPLAVLDRSAAGNPMGMNTGSSSSMEKLLAAWGMKFESAKVVADLDYVGRTREGRQPAVLALTEKAVNSEDILTADANNLFMVFAGAISGTPSEGLTRTVLLKTSKNSQFVDPMSAQFGGEKIVQDFSATNTEHALAVRLTGKFKTAFPDGKPKPATPPAEGEKKPEPPAGDSLKESKQDGAVLLIADSDMIQDQIAVQEMQNPFGGGQRMVMPANGNLAFVQGAIEQLSGDSNLIAVRSRASRERQFTVVKEMQAKAESAYQSKIKSLESSLAEAQAKLNDLQRTKADKGGQKFILSTEQQQEIANFRAKEREVKVQLKEERKKLRADIDSLENRIKWLNIALMPVLVAAAGVGLAVLRHKRRAAR
ncbi:MAG: Gldg family protein [Chthoniobacteraceae bacterium]